MRRICGLLALASALACSGLGPKAVEQKPKPSVDLEFAPQKPPTPKAEGLAGELGFPLGEGRLRSSTDKEAEVLYTSAFDPGVIWELQRAHLVAEGWTFVPSRIPPFRGAFEREGKRIALNCEAAGTSVLVQVRAR